MHTCVVQGDVQPKQVQVTSNKDNHVHFLRATRHTYKEYLYEFE
jgi:hypothetical protein